MKFDNLYNDWYLEESVLDLARDSLDPDIFQFPDQGAPIINNRIKQQILQGVQQIHLVVPVQDYFVVGSILTPRYNAHSDIDVTCEVEEDITPIALDNLIKVINSISGKLAIGTLHPINFHIVRGQADQDNYEAIYNIADDKWIKEPKTERFGIKNFINKFKTELSTVDLATAELRRDLIDFEELKEFTKDDLKNIDYEIKKLLSSIEVEVTKIVKMYDNAKIIRKSAFDKPLTPMEIRKFGAKNNLPENILYKLLERYYYKDLALKLKPLLEDGIEEDEIPKVAKTFKDFMKNI